MRSKTWFFVCLNVVVLFATAAFSDEQPLRKKGLEFAPKGPAVSRARVLRPELLKGEVRPLLVELPDLGGKPATVVVTIMAGEKTLVRETIAIEKGAAGSTVRIMAHQGKELEQLRKFEAMQPGTFRIDASIDDRPLPAIAFGEADLKSVELFEGKTSVVGATRLVDVSLAAKPKKVATNGMQPDPECEANCYNDYAFCVEYICDQRAGCQQCQQWYNDCLYSCPWVCVDPKDVDTFERTVYQGSDYYGMHCLTDMRDNQKYVFDTWLAHYQQQTVRRTEYCNGSYSEEVIDSYNFSAWCNVKAWPEQSCTVSEGFTNSFCY